MNGDQVAIFLIEGGEALRLVQEHIAHVLACQAESTAIAKELGVEHARTSRSTGKLVAVKFSGQPPKGWTVPDGHGCSRPKRGTDWHRH